MGNPLGNGNLINMSGSIQQVKQLMKTMQNPMSMMNNPQLNQVMQMCQGKNPKDLFYEECKKRNIDGDAIIRELQN